MRSLGYCNYPLKLLEPPQISHPRPSTGLERRYGVPVECCAWGESWWLTEKDGERVLSPCDEAAASGLRADRG